LIFYPGDEPTDLLVGEQRFDCILVPSEVFFAGDKSMNRAMAIVANRNGPLHFSPGETLFKPFVVVTATGNQVMFGRTFASQPAAKLTGFRLGGW
jgi:hypothetical protein